jgi:hypothetical protein
MEDVFASLKLIFLIIEFFLFPLLLSSSPLLQLCSMENLMLKSLPECSLVAQMLVAWSLVALSLVALSLVEWSQVAPLMRMLLLLLAVMVDLLLSIVWLGSMMEEETREVLVRWLIITGLECMAGGCPFQPRSNLLFLEIRTSFYYQRSWYESAGYGSG